MKSIRTALTHDVAGKKREFTLITAAFLVKLFGKSSHNMVVVLIIYLSKMSIDIQRAVICFRRKMFTRPINNQEKKHFG